MPTPELAAQQQPLRPLPSFIAPAAPGLPDPTLELHEDGVTVKSAEYRNAAGQLHRKDGPAWQSWYANGVKNYEQWYVDDKLHREDGSAWRWWYANGVKYYEQWWVDDVQVDPPSSR